MPSKKQTPVATKKSAPPPPPPPVTKKAAAPAPAVPPRNLSKAAAAAKKNTKVITSVVELKEQIVQVFSEPPAPVEPADATASQLPAAVIEDLILEGTLLTDEDSTISPAVYTPHVERFNKDLTAFKSDNRMKKLETQLKARNSTILETVKKTSITDDVGSQVIGALLVQNARNMKLVSELFDPVWRASKDAYDGIRTRRDEILKAQELIATEGKKLLANYDREKRERLEREAREAEMERQRIEQHKRKEAADLAKAEENRQNAIRAEQEAEELAALPDDATEEQVNAILSKYGTPIIIQPKTIEMPPPPMILAAPVKVEGNTFVENYEVELTSKAAFVLHALGLPQTTPCNESAWAAHSGWIDIDMGKIKRYVNSLHGVVSIPGLRVYRQDTVRTSSR